MIKNNLLQIGFTFTVAPMPVETMAEVLTVEDILPTAEAVAEVLPTVAVLP